MEIVVGDLKDITENNLISQQDVNKALAFIENHQNVIDTSKINDYVFKYIGKRLVNQFNERVRNDFNKI